MLFAKALQGHLPPLSVLFDLFAQEVLWLDMLYIALPARLCTTVDTEQTKGCPLFNLTAVLTV